jgi:hypothetical protein
MELAKTFAESFGQGEVLAWGMEEKARVAPHPVRSGATSPHPEPGKRLDPPG